MSFRMYVATHQRTSLPDDPGYVPIQVGRAVSGVDLDLLSDDIGDNISNKNATFCECTALYWILKNCTADVVGLSHYRRFFAPSTNAYRFGDHAIASSADFSDINTKFDLIVPAPIGFINGTTKTQESLEQNYFGTATGFDLFLAREAIRRLDASYLDAFDFVMRNCQLIPFNMMIGDRKVVTQYLEWLFPILFTLESWIPFDTYSSYQKRAIGFLAERLHTVWTVANRANYKIGYRPVVFCE